MKRPASTSSLRLAYDDYARTAMAAAMAAVDAETFALRDGVGVEAAKIEAAGRIATALIRASELQD